MVRSVSAWYGWKQRECPCQFTYSSGHIKQSTKEWIKLIVICSLELSISKYHVNMSSLQKLLVSRVHILHLAHLSSGELITPPGFH